MGFHKNNWGRHWCKGLELRLDMGLNMGLDMEFGHRVGDRQDDVTEEWC